MNTDKAFRNACGKFATGVTIITCKNGENIHGMTANGFMSVSLDPALIVISIGKSQKMHNELMNSDKFAVSVLHENQRHLSDHFAGRKMDGIEVNFDYYYNSATVSDALAFFVASIKSRYDEGDHTLFVGEIKEFGTHEIEDLKPLCFHCGQYKNLV